MVGMADSKVSAKVLAKVAAANERLRLARSPVRLKIVGTSIALRATLPPPPKSTKVRPFQQEIRLGLPATMQAIVTAQGKARVLESQLVAKAFSWDLWRSPKASQPDHKLTKHWIAEFEAYYKDTHKIFDRTWTKDWGSAFAHLDGELELTADLLTKAARRSKPNTCTRKRDCEKLQHLANFAKIEVDLRQYRGEYSPTSVGDRTIPTDEEIVAAVLRIRNPGWRWIAGAMAAWGLRDHEAFFATPTGDGGIVVAKGKTGPRRVESAFYPEWVDLFGVNDKKLPNVDAETNYEKGLLGAATSEAFRRAQVGFPPYDLRHAWAIRVAVVFELPATIAAAEMGHSPATHYQVYHRHITAAQKAAGVQRALKKKDRPQWDAKQKPPE